MNYLHTSIAVTLTLVAVSAEPIQAAKAESPLFPDILTCEYLENPKGIDTPQPRLSWQLQSTERNMKQSAYQVIVSSSIEKLNSHVGDTWDSGKVSSGQSIHVQYSGPSLKSHQVCWWSVRVWDSDDKPSAWSRPASWSMGILQPADWKASWIGYTKPPKERLLLDDAAKFLNFDGCHWMWSTDDSSLEKLPKGKRCFRLSLEIPDNDPVRWAYMLAAADDRYWMFINGRRYSISRLEPDAWKQAYEIDLTSKLRPGHNTIAVEVENISEGPAGLAGKIVVALKSGKTIIKPIDTSWKSSIKGGKNWQQPDFDDKDWPPARPVAKVGEAPWSTPQTGYATGWLQKAPSPMLRNTFKLKNMQIKRATVYVCGIGYYELHLNGQKVGDHQLDPAFTRYDKRVLYVTHDISYLLNNGDNAIGIMLGNGWYNMHTRATWDFDQAPWRNEPRAMLHLRVEYSDGSVETIATDSSWKASTGPLLLDSIRAGEVYDARLEQADWDTAKFNESGWGNASIMDAPAGIVKAMMMPPIRITETISPIALTEPRPGVFVFDMGQNMPGWAKLYVTGKSGTTITMRYAEKLRGDGLIDQGNIDVFVFAGPFQQDTYILKGGEEERWESRFAYHGFRYVEVTGWPGKPTLDSIRGRVAHTDFKPAGTFQCSNGLLDDIQKLTLWSYRGNYHGYPTDCPQREKNGWTGDAHLAAEQAMFNWHNNSSYTKWMNDFADEQKEDGNVAAIIPTGGWGYAWGNGPAWDSAYLLIPWYMYQYLGDTQILKDHYEKMKLYVDYMTSRSEDHRVKHGLGDWAPAKTTTPAPLTSTGYYYVDTMIVAQTAKLLNMEETADNYIGLADRIRASFNKAWYKGEGRYEPTTQTSLSCAIFQDMAEQSERPLVIDRLVELINAADGHLDVGILGAKYLFNTLSDYGRHDLAYRIATQTTMPSYGTWVKEGATTLTENWNSESSLNHIMFGDISAWFYKYLAGIRIDPANPGFKRTIIRPLPTGDLTWVHATHNSMYGPIESKWKIEDKMFKLNVVIPPNTTAIVYIPSGSIRNITESGKAVKKIKDIKLLENKTRETLLEIGSGTYKFEAPWGQ